MHHISVTITANKIIMLFTHRIILTFRLLIYDFILPVTDRVKTEDKKSDAIRKLIVTIKFG